MSVKVISDSTCDLSPELIEEYGVDILPLHILLDDEEYKDGVNIKPEEIYAWSDAHGTTPKTSAPALADALALLKKYKEEYDEMICFAISSSMSSSYNVFKLASEELEISDRVHVIDSKNLCTGIGILILEACDLIAEGKSGKEVAEIIETIVPKVRSTFILETLEYLSRGGRCNSITAIMGGALKIHPVIVVDGGDMRVGKKYRGPLHKVVMHYATDLKENLLKADNKRVFLCHSGIDEEIMDEAREFLKGLNYFGKIEECRAGGVISSHCGPGTFAIIYRD